MVLYRSRPGNRKFSKGFHVIRHSGFRGGGVAALAIGNAIRRSKTEKSLAAIAPPPRKAHRAPKCKTPLPSIAFVHLPPVGDQRFHFLT